MKKKLTVSHNCNYTRSSYFIPLVSSGDQGGRREFRMRRFYF